MRRSAGFVLEPLNSTAPGSRLVGSAAQNCVLSISNRNQSNQARSLNPQRAYYSTSAFIQLFLKFRLAQLVHFKASALTASDVMGKHATLSVDDCKESLCRQLIAAFVCLFTTDTV